MKQHPGRTLRNIILFSFVVLICGWIGRLVDLQAGRDASGSLGQLIWIVTPLLTMVVLRSWMGDGWRDFGLLLRFRPNGLLYVFSILFFPVLAVLVVGVGSAMGWIEVSGSSSTFFMAFVMALLPSFLKNIFEEFAWRGYLAPRLFSLGYNRFLVHIVVGMIWGAWHFPYMFLFVATTESMLTYIPRMMLGMIVMAVLYGEILLMSRSVWPAVIMHTTGNAFINTLLLEKYIAVHPQFEFAAMPSPEGMLAMGITALAGWWMYSSRRKLRRTAGDRGYGIHSI